jgi:hypothetical protein
MHLDRATDDALGSPVDLIQLCVSVLLSRSISVFSRYLSVV